MAGLLFVFTPCKPATNMKAKMNDCAHHTSNGYDQRRDAGLDCISSTNAMFGKPDQIMGCFWSHAALSLALRNSIWS